MKSIGDRKQQFYGANRRERRQQFSGTNRREKTTILWSHQEREDNNSLEPIRERRQQFSGVRERTFYIREKPDNNQ
jgi:hypothetical protein